MLDFCFDCVNAYFQGKLRREDVGLSEDLVLCEDCNQMKHVVVMIHDVLKLD
jgi:hypothetical protein